MASVTCQGGNPNLLNLVEVDEEFALGVGRTEANSGGRNSIGPRLPSKEIGVGEDDAAFFGDARS